MIFCFPGFQDDWIYFAYLLRLYMPPDPNNLLKESVNI